MTTLIPEEIAELFESGVSILVGTRDADLRAEPTRAVGAVVHPDRRTLTIFIPVAIATRTLNNLEDNGLIAVGFSSIMDHRTLQVKGTVTEVRDATAAERVIITRYHAAYAEVLFGTGVPRAKTSELNVWPSMAITLTATDLFQQTPGPNAGARVAG